MNRALACIVLAVAATIGMAGCGESSPSGNDNDPNNAKPLLPLAVGNQWLYESTIYDSTGRATSKKDTTAIRMDTTIQGEKWYFFNDDRVTPTASRTDGIYYWDTKLNVARLYLKYPGTVGSTYERGSQRYTITSINTNVDVPAGVFSCYQVGFTDQNVPGLRGTISMSPGVGTVKIELINTRTDGSVQGSARMELKSYTLK